MMRHRIRQLLAGVRGLLRRTEESEGLVAAAPAVPVGELFRRFWPYARPYRRWMPLILVLAALGPAIEAATIWMYKVLVDEVLVPREFGLLVWVMLAYIGLTLVAGFVTFCDEYLSEWVGGRFIVSLRSALFAHLQGLSLEFFNRRSLGDMISRLSDDVDEIEELMLSGVTSALAYLFQLVFFVGALFYLEWRLALVSLLVVPFFWFAARHFSRKIKRAARESFFVLANAAGIALYEKFGLEIEGTHRCFAFREGEYVDAYSMVRVRE